jgi:hypothetical protein
LRAAGDDRDLVLETEFLKIHGRDPIGCCQLIQLPPSTFSVWATT